MIKPKITFAQPELSSKSKKILSFEGWHAKQDGGGFFEKQI